MLNSFLYLQEDLEQDNGHSSDLDQKRSGILSVMIVHKVNGTKWLNWWWYIQRKRTSSLPSHESIVQRSAQKQRWWKIVDALSSRPRNDNTCFSHNYFCESAQSLGSSRRHVWRIWILSRGKTLCGRTVEFLVRAECDQHTCHWTMMVLHIKNCFCKDMENELKKYHHKTEWANFVRMQDSWLLLKLYSISWRKTLKKFSQFTDSVACREYTLPRDEDTSEPKGWIRGNTKIGPVLEVTTCCLQGKYGVEIRIMSVNKDNSHSWARISHGLNKLVTNLNNNEQDDNEQETSEVQFEDCALKTNVLALASRSKAKAKPQRRDSASSSTKTVPIGENLGPILNHKLIRPSIIQCRSNWALFFVMVIYLEKMMERLNSGD